MAAKCVSCNEYGIGLEMKRNEMLLRRSVNEMEVIVITIIVVGI